MPENGRDENMPIWQNHEQRITTLEATFAGFSHRIRAVDKKMEEMETSSEKRWKSIEKKLDEGNDEQKELLNTLISHHLETKKMKVSNFWQVIINITGTGGLLIAIVYAIVQLIEFLGGS